MINLLHIEPFPSQYIAASTLFRNCFLVVGQRAACSASGGIRFSTWHSSSLPPLVFL